MAVFAKAARIYLLSLVIAIVGTLPVWAGQWKTTYSNNGTYNFSSINLSHPSGSGSWTIGGSSGGAYSLGIYSATTSGTVIATLIWVPNVGVADPPPSTLYLTETSAAMWETGTGTSPTVADASDGLGDPCKVTQNVPPGLRGLSYGQRIIKVDSSSGRVVRQCTLSASLMCDPKTAIDYLGWDVSCSYSLEIPPPHRPPAVGLSASSDTENDLYWKFNEIPLFVDSAPPVINNVYRSTDPALPKPWALVASFPTEPYVAQSTGQAGVYQDIGLQANTQYFYYITGTDKYGQESYPSSILSSATDAMTITADIDASGDSVSGSTPSSNSLSQPALSSNVSALAATSPSKAPNKYFLSGTDNTATSGAIIVPTDSRRIVRIVQKVNGKVTNSQIFPGVLSAFIRSRIDSTYFPNGSPVTVATIVYVINGSTQTRTATKLALNQAAIYGNVQGFKDNPAPIQTSVSRVSSTVGTKMNHLVYSSTTDYKGAILSSMFAYTAFYIATHSSGVPRVAFSDCTGSSSDANTLFATSDPTGNSDSIATAVGHKNTQPKPFPAYNFVFIDGCASAQYPDFAYAFGVSSSGGTIPDRAFLGWNVSVKNTMQLANWTTLLWNSLRNGIPLSMAVNAANMRYPLGANLRNQPEIPVVNGDHYMKLHGLYQENGLGYFKALP